VRVTAEQPFPNDLQDRVRFRKDVTVRESQHVETMLRQYDGPRRIASHPSILVVLATVQLDDQHALDAGEVGEERTDGMLPTKFVPGEAAVAQLGPEKALGVGGGGAELAARAPTLTPALSRKRERESERSLLPLPLAGEGWVRVNDPSQSPWNTGFCFAANAS
jgi:hypothetical protein